jgi:hypothetical protein
MVVRQRVCVGADSLVLRPCRFSCWQAKSERGGHHGSFARLRGHHRAAARGPLLCGGAVNVLVRRLTGRAEGERGRPVGSTMCRDGQARISPRLPRRPQRGAATVGRLSRRASVHHLMPRLGASVANSFPAGTLSRRAAGLRRTHRVRRWPIATAIRGEQPQPARAVGRSYPSPSGAAEAGHHLGGICGGLVDPTEAGALAVGYGLLVGSRFYRTLHMRVSCAS